MDGGGNPYIHVTHRKIQVGLSRSHHRQVSNRGCRRDRGMRMPCRSVQSVYLDFPMLEWLVLRQMHCETGRRTEPRGCDLDGFEAQDLTHACSSVASEPVPFG